MLTAPPPGRHVVSTDLLPLAGAARHGRNMVTAACLRWDISHRLGAACLVVSELVSDSGSRFSGPSTLTALRSRDRLYMAVRRGVSAPLPEDHSEPDMGFRLVHAFADCWGVFPHGGDVITWAAIDVEA